MKKKVTQFFFRLIILLWVPGLMWAQDTKIQQADEWEPELSADAGLSMVSIVQGTPGNAGKVFIGYTGGSVYVTENAKDPAPLWTRVFPGEDDPLPGSMVTDIAIDPSDTTRVYVSFENKEEGSLIRTEDGGMSWTEVSGPAPDIRGISIHPLNPALLYVIAGEEIYVSEDSGTSWASDITDDPFLMELEPGDIISTIEQLTYNTRMAFVGTKQGHIYTCSDIFSANPYWYRITGGSSPLPPRTITSIAIDTRSQRPALFITSGCRESDPEDQTGIWRSLSGGVDWESIHTENIPAGKHMNSISINPYYQDFLYLCYADTGSARSLDRGITWTLIPTKIELLLSIKYRDGNYGTVADNHIKPHFKIMNNGTTGIPLSELTIKYWYTIDSPSNQLLWVDYAYIGNSRVLGTFGSVESTEGADSFLEVSFSEDAGILTAGGTSGELQLRFNKSDWSDYDETNDYSYMSTGIYYEETDTVSLYWKGELIWGREP